MTLQLMINGLFGSRSFFNRNANIRDLYDLTFVEENTPGFPNGHFQFMAIVNEKVLNAYIKHFEPHKFEKNNQYDIKIKNWNKK